MPIFQLSEEEKEKVPRIYHQDPSTTQKDISYLREWISKQPHLPQQHEDIWLKSFLMGCKYSLEKCKKKLDAYFTVRIVFPQYFSNRDPAAEDIRETCSKVAMFLLPSLHPSGRIVAFFKNLSCEETAINVEYMYRRVSIIGDCMIRESPNLRIIIIADNEGVSLQHFSQFTPLLIKHGAYIMNKAYPISVDGLHLLNTTSSSQLAFKIIWPFLNPKVKERVHYYRDNIADLYDHVPKEMLPNEYGGKAGSVQELNEAFQERVESSRDWFLAHSVKVSDQSKRPVQNKCSENLFGLDGSFKQLNID